MSTNETALWEAFGDSRRREIVELLATRPCTVAELTRALPISQPAISQHLKVLRDAGLVDFHTRGARRIYRVRPDGLAALRADLDRFWATALAHFTRIVDESTSPDEASTSQKGPHHDHHE